MTDSNANDHQRGPITAGLAYDVCKVLDAHGYTRGDDSALGAAVILLGDLVDGYEGRTNSMRVPRGTDQSRELSADVDHLRELLGVIADVLDVPLGDDVDAGLRLTRDRAILVRHAARDAAEMPLTLTEAQHLKVQVAEHAPAPKGGAR